MGTPGKLVALASVMSFWIPMVEINSAVWISIFLPLSISFNLFNVRRYGEIEYWLTAIKVISCIGIIILGLVLPMDASPRTRLLGTTDDHQLIPCPNPGTSNCLPPPGFGCITCAHE